MKFALCIDPSSAHSGKVFVKEFDTIIEAKTFFKNLNLRFQQGGECETWTHCAEILRKAPHTGKFANYLRTTDGASWKVECDENLWDITAWNRIDDKLLGLWNEVYLKIRKEAVDEQGD